MFKKYLIRLQLSDDDGGHDQYTADEFADGEALIGECPPGYGVYPKLITAKEVETLIRILDETDRRAKK